MESEDKKKNILRPPIKNYLTELPRAMRERYNFSNYIKNFEAEPFGIRRPVLVIPGFMSSGTSTKPLRDFVEKLGFKVFDWNLGFNWGHLSNLDSLEKWLEKIYREEEQKITVIGWSLGGVYGRHLAHEFPDKVAELITLGSPFAGLTEPNNAAWLFQLIHFKHPVELVDAELLEKLPQKPDVPTLAIFSKEDGIVPWEACRESNPDEYHKNKEVKGSHIGLGMNIQVFEAIFEALREEG